MKILPCPVMVVLIADDGVLRVFPGHMNAHDDSVLLLPAVYYSGLWAGGGSE
jgi:hypothetical protein